MSGLIGFFFLSAVAYAQSNYIGSGICLDFPEEPDNYVDLGDVYNDLDFPLTFEAWVYPHTKASGNFTGCFPVMPAEQEIIMDCGSASMKMIM